jgi:hypothetical protein
MAAAAAAAQVPVAGEELPKIPRAHLFKRHEAADPALSAPVFLADRSVGNVYPQPDGAVRCVVTHRGAITDDRVLHVDPSRLLDNLDLGGNDSLHSPFPHDEKER